MEEGTMWELTESSSSQELETKQSATGSTTIPKEGVGWSQVSRKALVMTAIGIAQGLAYKADICVPNKHVNSALSLSLSLKDNTNLSDYGFPRRSHWK